MLLDYPDLLDVWGRTYWDCCSGFCGLHTLPVTKTNSVKTFRNIDYEKLFKTVL